MSTCHWCHVMGEESFEDEEVAEILNKDFVAVKVDREERPDVDSVYMTVCQAFTGAGGWPLTIIMTPDQRPFFAGTYYPKEARYGRPGLMELLSGVSKKWKKDKEKLIESSDDIVNALEGHFNAQNDPGELSRHTIERAMTLFEHQFDDNYGGFGKAPKFPTPHHLMFLLRYYDQEGDQKALEMAEKTLEQMYKGGMFDHIGFGFSRYSTDNKWLVPHFEKMLYDNALLTSAYLEAYQLTGKVLYKEVAEKTITYVLRELTDDKGGFYCAQDADSEGEEGKYYVFTPEEVTNLLGEEDGHYFNEYYDITKKGNFEGKSIPNLIRNVDLSHANEKINQLSKKVFEYRLHRTDLHKDDKILTSWNALMITAFAKAYKILREEKYKHAAEKAIRFIQDHLINENGRLLARYRKGEASYLAYLDDYAFFVWALMEMYEATFEAEYLKKAVDFNGEMMSYFWDDENDGFYLYGKDSEQLIARPKELYDGAMPSGNSVAAYNLIRLARLTGRKDMEELADRQLKVFTSSTAEYPLGYSFYLFALLFALYPSEEIVCIMKNQKDLEALNQTISRSFMPSKTFLVITKDNEALIHDIAAFTASYLLKDDQTTYYICQNNACAPPSHTLRELESRL